MALTDDIRAAGARVAARARHVRLREEAIAPYAAALPLPPPGPALDPEAHVLGGPLEDRAAFHLCLDAINFGSGWFPTLRKRPGRSGYFTVAIGLRERWAAAGPWPAAALARIRAGEVAATLGQDPGHELMELFARALRELGEQVAGRFDGSFLALARAGGGSAVALAEELARWPTWRDVAEHDGEPVPFFKRAQIAAADLALAGVADFHDLDALTLFADNLVPHVLRLDGVLELDPALTARIDAGELIRHGSPEEVEIRAVALHAVERIVAARGGDATAALVDLVLWNRGQDASYKARPRHRSRCTAY